MTVGIDLDNTVVSYDALFHEIAAAAGLIPAGFPASKTAIRDHLRAANREADWTRMQGRAYGSRMEGAQAFPGALDFIGECRARGVAVRIISHRTRQPYAGESCDLHGAALRWLEAHGLCGPGRQSEVYLEATRQAKHRRIASAGCTHFIDDLPEFLADADFPPGVERILFDPAGVHRAPPGASRFGSWQAIAAHLLGSVPGDDADGVRAAAAALLRPRGRIVAGALERLGAGGNNRVFRAHTGDGGSCIVKAYYRAPGGGRDRLDSERRFYRFARKAAPAWTTADLAWDAGAAVGVFEEIRGRRPQPGQVGDAEVAAALGFFCAINAARGSVEAAELPPAAEACFSAAEHLEAIEGRLERLQSAPAPTELERQAHSFVDREMAPAWRQIKAAVGGAPGPVLGASERCISPSDFGFHNCLVRDGGPPAFLDFEYAGWDDPAKMVCDFFCQPSVPVPMVYLERFSREVAAALGGGEKFLARCRALLPAYRLKWCGIMLNEFVAGGRERRSFALGAEVTAARRERQLAAARSALTALVATL
ncbi:MAG TPA: phosphotransferase [Opitutaceae bacterium]|jgi:hypothetical protein